MTMDITLEARQGILDYVIQQYFSSTNIEKLVLEYIGKNSIAGQFTKTKDICQYLYDQHLETSTGAIRGTILRIRHKLLKYRELNRNHAFHLIFPEQASRRGYILQFEKNPGYRVIKQSSPNDPWLVMNWNGLRKQGYRGLWRGFSLPDGGRWPVKLYVWLNSVMDEKTEEEKFMCLLNSPSSTKHRIGILEGEIKDKILCMQGKWCVHYKEYGLKEFQISARMWPFRTNPDDPVKISGRFILYHEPLNEYQEGQIELDFCSCQSLGPNEFVLT